MKVAPEEREKLKLVKKHLGGASIYQMQFAELSENEWAVSVSTGKNARDRRFRFTRGQLFDEALIGDARI